MCKKRVKPAARGFDKQPMRSHNVRRTFMKSLQVTAPGEFQILDVPMPRPHAGEVLLRIEAVTTCPQWDLHLRHNEPMFVGHQFKYPYAPGQPGHEATGFVEAVGAGVTTVTPGDRVSAWRDQGHHLAGCYAQFAILQVDNVIRVPEALPLHATAPVELAMCVGATFLMLKSMDAIRGRRFGVMGLGPAGLIAAQMAQAEGAADVFGFDLSEARRVFAAQLGVTSSYDPRDDLAERFPLRPAKTRLDCAIDCVGARSAIEFLMDHTDDVVALFGVQREPVAFTPAHANRLRLCGYSGHSRAAAEYAVDLISRGRLDLGPLTTAQLPLERYNDGIDLLERQAAIKICFRPWLDG